MKQMICSFPNNLSYLSRYIICHPSVEVPGINTRTFKSWLEGGWLAHLSQYSNLARSSNGPFYFVAHGAAGTAGPLVAV
jgi:hypothetical protein